MKTIPEQLDLICARIKANRDRREAIQNDQRATIVSFINKFPDHPRTPAYRAIIVRDNLLQDQLAAGLARNADVKAIEVAICDNLSTLP